MRPVLCLATAEALGIEAEALRPFALAVELLHTSSLIHDDLPALDNDDFRRGEPSSHKRFGEATAILAGDLLLILAFRVLGESGSVTPEARLAWLELLGEAACELCDGQIRDLVASGKAKPLGAAEPLDVETLCRKKTAALFRAILCAPAAIAPDKHWALAPLRCFGEQLGLLFQITDDLLDDSQDEMSYVRAFGQEGAEQRADEALRSALAAVPEGPEFELLRELSRRVRSRKS